MDDLKFTTCGDFMKDQEQDKYAVVTVISQFRQRYVMPVSKLQEKNTTISLTDHPEQIVPWAEDAVTCEETKEFSQKWLGEQIVDTFILDEERVLQLFDRDNSYLLELTTEKKLESIQDCWEKKKDVNSKK